MRYAQWAVCDGAGKILAIFPWQERPGAESWAREREASDRRAGKVSSYLVQRIVRGDPLPSEAPAASPDAGRAIRVGAARANCRWCGQPYSSPEKCPACVRAK